MNKNAIEIAQDGYEPAVSVIVSCVRCKVPHFKKIYLVIYLAAPGLTCSMWVLFSCSMQDL